MGSESHGRQMEYDSGEGQWLIEADNNSGELQVDNDNCE